MNNWRSACQAEKVRDETGLQCLGAAIAEAVRSSNLLMVCCLNDYGGVCIKFNSEYWRLTLHEIALTQDSHQYHDAGSTIVMIVEPHVLSGMVFVQGYTFHAANIFRTQSLV